MNKLFIFTFILLSVNAEAKKVIVSNTNIPGQVLLMDVIGFIPENYLFDAPEEAEVIGDLDLNVEKRTAQFNKSKYNARLEAEAARKARFEADKQQEKVILDPIISKIDADQKLTDTELNTFLKSVK